MKKIFFIILILLNVIIGYAQSLESANLLIEKEGKCYLVENGRKSLVNDKVITVKLKVGKDIDRKEFVSLRENKLGYVDLKVPNDVSFDAYAKEHGGWTYRLFALSEAYGEMIKSL